MSKKAARRKTTKKPPALSAKPLRDLGGKTLLRVPASGTITTWGSVVGGKPPRPRTEIAGVPLPPDLEAAVRYYAGEHFRGIEEEIRLPPWAHSPNDDESEEDYPEWKPPVLNPVDWLVIRRTLEDSFRQGFYLALLRYADDLKNVPEAAALLEARRDVAKKGGAARRAAAEPTHKAIRKRFRELRKTIKKKTARYLRVAEEFEMSDRQVQRIVDGMD